jgi:hypothetical protein
VRGLRGKEGKFRYLTHYFFIISELFLVREYLYGSVSRQANKQERKNNFLDNENESEGKINNCEVFE